MQVESGRSHGGGFRIHGNYYELGQPAEKQLDTFRRMKIILKRITGIQANDFTGWFSRPLDRIQSYGHLVPGTPALGAHLEWRQVMDWYRHLGRSHPLRRCSEAKVWVQPVSGKEQLGHGEGLQEARGQHDHLTGGQTPQAIREDNLRL